VELAVRGRLIPRQTYRLSANGTSPTGLSNDWGFLLDGRQDGHPGNDFVSQVVGGVNFQRDS
jgi:hypothetical protein